MTPKGPWPGRFIWHDLMTKDAERAQTFYCSLFGWKIEEKPMPGMTYRMIVAGPGPIGGIVLESNIPSSHWMAYVHVADVDAGARKCKELGGSVCVDPTDIPGVGRFAVIGDPQGAYLSIYRGKDGDDSGFDPDQPVPGRVCWNELLTTDDAAACRFYAAMFGWRDQPKNMGPMGTYHVQMLGSKQAGGIMKNPEAGAPPFWIAYFLAPDIEAGVAKASALGATLCIPPTPIPDIGRFAYLTDPTGAMFALFQPL